jgi:large subunit ribosomal protein L44e
MQVPRIITTYCPKCNKHTPHTVILSSGKKPIRGNAIGNRRHDRKLKGYIGKVKGQATVKKISKRQKIILKCTICNSSIERVEGTRTKKRIAIKA